MIILASIMGIHMKKAIFFLAASLAACIQTFAQTSDSEAFLRWKDDKYSMFIHFGLYSHFGGVCDGEPVRQGYSEQIQSFAGIFSDWYASEAYAFDPKAFDAERIAELAKAGGMRSIVFTSKHHDGFCMFDTKTTGYSSVAMMPSHRDFVKEISEACARHGLKFGLYFSLIDWNYPHAYPISSHNADFVTPEHHEFSKAQVRELLTNYGPVSELWFDMGSLEPWQSSELYDLVKELQPDCMVSGRLGNDVYDFAVMADNKLPQSALHAPWQSAASMFPETWSYRSWQERGRVEDKVAEKLRSLIEVVSHGGNYLLNIGPASDGSVVPFEDEVIRKVGAWLEKNGDAVYGTSPSPFREKFAWGYVTVKDDVMYLLLTGEYPEEGIVLPFEDGDVRVDVTPDMFGKPEVEVVRIPYEGSVARTYVSSSESLSWINADKDYSYSCFDYYSNYRSTVGYGWNVKVKRPMKALELTYTADEIGRKVRLTVGDADMEVELDGNTKVDLTPEIKLEDISFGRMRGGVFDNPIDLQRVAQWEPLGQDDLEVPSQGFTNWILDASVSSAKQSYAVCDVRAGNGVELVVDGRTMMKHLNPYRTSDRTEKVLLDLSRGESRILVRSYNRFENTARAGLKISDNQKVYRMKVLLPEAVKAGEVRVGVSAADRSSGHTDCGLHNLIIRMLR